MYSKDWPPQSAYTYIKMTLLIPPVPFIWEYHTLCLVLNYVVLHWRQLTKCLKHLLHLLKRSVIQLMVATVRFHSQSPFYVMHSLIFLLKHIERDCLLRAAQTDRTDTHQRNFYSPSKFTALWKSFVCRYEECWSWMVLYEFDTLQGPFTSVMI